MGFSVSASLARSTQPSYMYQSPSGYIFRIKIPADLRHLVGKCEFRYSLRTGSITSRRVSSLFPITLELKVL
jgi:hypothetical protein